MAHHDLETRAKRHDVRLDNFLRKNLVQENYERIHASEPCVLISPVEKRVHRYVILGHTHLFSTEFPPRTLRTLLKLKDIALINVVRISLFNSYNACSLFGNWSVPGKVWAMYFCHSEMLVLAKMNIIF